MEKMSARNQPQKRDYQNLQKIISSDPVTFPEHFLEREGIWCFFKKRAKQDTKKAKMPKDM